MKISARESNPKTTSLNNGSLFSKRPRDPFFSAEQKENQPFFKPIVQAKLTIGQPDDPFEKEADSMAEKIVSQVESSGKTPALQAKCTDCEEEEIQKKEEDEGLGIQEFLPDSSFSLPNDDKPDKKASTPGIQLKAGLEGALQSSKGKGSPLPEKTLSEMETGFGKDFSSVRVHTDSLSGRMNKELRAKAFTHGTDIYFNNGNYDVSGNSGKKLLAHELTHVVQQQPNKISRFPYQTIGMPLDRTQIATMASQSYWEQKTFQAFVTSVDSRISSDPEERDAVLSAMWGLPPPTTVRSRTEKIVPIASRTIPGSGTTSSSTAPALLYKFVFSPPASRGALPQLVISFIGSGTVASTAPVALPAATSGFTPASPGSTSWTGFSGTLADFWTANPDEHAAVFSWIQNTAPASFNATVIANTTNTRGAVTHSSLLLLSGSHTGNTVSSLSVTLISEGASARTVEASQTVPTNYRDRDMGELELEKLQAASPAADRLGTVTLPSTIPADERLPVRYAIWQYFKFGNSRNTEVDIIVPVGTASRNVLYTLVFSSGNNVSATRIGEAGTGTGMININRVDVTRIKGFPGQTATTAVLRSWWAARYPHGGTLTADPPAAQAQGGQQGSNPTSAPTAASLIGEMNAFITAGIANRTWFNQNYNIEVLDAAGTATRLQTAHAIPAAATTDTVDFSTQDLLMLELAFQTMDSHLLARLAGIKLGRKTAAIVAGGGAGGATQYGLTLMNSTGGVTEITVLYFQSLYSNNDNLFRGSTAANVLPDVSMNFLHELGHAAGHRAGIETAFNTWKAANHPANPTWYAASAGGELFPEAFALYHTDPHFLCSSSPLMYAWFDALVTTGSPPPATPALTAPTSCPA